MITTRTTTGWTTTTFGATGDPFWLQKGAQWTGQCSNPFFHPFPTCLAVVCFLERCMRVSVCVHSHMPDPVLETQLKGMVLTGPEAGSQVSETELNVIPEAEMLARRSAIFVDLFDSIRFGTRLINSIWMSTWISVVLAAWIDCWLWQVFLPVCAAEYWVSDWASRW